MVYVGSSIQHKTALDAVFADYGFTWDAGNRITEFETVDGMAEYTYDKTGQLTGADYDYITDELYTYDDNGNRTNSGYVTGENNETLSDGTYRYSYDNEGNRTEKFLWTDTNNDGIIDASEKTLVQTYNWDYRNRLESVTNYESGIAKEVINYLYDYLNLMIERTVTDAATSVLQSSEYNLYSNGQVVLEYDTTSSVDVLKSVNLWGANIDELVAVEKMAQNVNDSNVILWTYGDHLNSIRDVVLYDSIIQTAAVVNHLVYNAFGVLVSSTDGSTNNPASISPLLNYRYTGKFFDDSTGLQNNINRWYDATTGRWLSTDPIGFNGGDVNLYRYVGNKSLLSRDIYGLYTLSEEELNSSLNQEKIKQIIDELSNTGQLLTDKNNNYIIPIPNKGKYAIVKLKYGLFSPPKYVFVGFVDIKERKDIVEKALKEAKTIIDNAYKLFNDKNNKTINDCLCKYYGSSSEEVFSHIKTMIEIIHNGLSSRPDKLINNINIEYIFVGSEKEFLVTSGIKGKRVIKTGDFFYKGTPHNQIYGMIHEFHHYFLKFSDEWKYGSSDYLIINGEKQKAYYFTHLYDSD